MDQTANHYGQTQQTLSKQAAAKNSVNSSNYHRKYLTDKTNLPQHYQNNHKSYSSDHTNHTGSYQSIKNYENRKKELLNEPLLFSDAKDEKPPVRSNSK